MHRTLPQNNDVWHAASFSSKRPLWCKREQQTEVIMLRGESLAVDNGRVMLSYCELSCRSGGKNGLWSWVIEEGRDHCWGNWELGFFSLGQRVSFRTCSCVQILQSVLEQTHLHYATPRHGFLKKYIHDNIHGSGTSFPLSARCSSVSENDIFFA